jgi:basic membrane lipoprotein Med (substrate-binding protein (PBP1-ABC) superfamily)
VKLGAVRVGWREDFDWNQAHAETIEVLRRQANVSVVEEGDVAETQDVTRSMGPIIKLDGADFMLGVSFGYFDPFMIDLAKRHPDVQVRHAAPPSSAERHLAHFSCRPPSSPCPQWCAARARRGSSSSSAAAASAAGSRYSTRREGWCR